MTGTRRYQAGTVHYLNYDEFSPAGAEMTKGRAVVIVTPKKRRQQNLVIVVPLSTKPPETFKRHTVRIMHDELNGKNGGCWAKCDMPTTVSTRRLLDYRRPKYRGQNHIPTIRISGDELMRVRDAMGRAIGLKEAFDRLVQQQPKSVREVLQSRITSTANRAVPIQKVPSRSKVRRPIGLNRPVSR